MKHAAHNMGTETRHTFLVGDALYQELKEIWDLFGTTDKLKESAHAFLTQVGNRH